MADLETPEKGVTILDTHISLKVIMAPAAAQRLAHIFEEAGTANGIVNSDSIMCLSTYSSLTNQ